MGLASSSWGGIWEPDFRGRIYEWASENARLGPPYTKSGYFDVSSSRHMIALFDSFQSSFVRETNALAPIRGAKTLFADMSHLWAIKVRPAPTLFLFQDEKAARDQAELRTWPNIMRCDSVRSMLSGDRHKNRTCDIIFPHMVFHIRGPADSNLNSRGYQNVWLDEPWLYKSNKLEEARGRLGDFAKNGTDKLVCLSQGGYIGDDWDRQFNRGVIHEWHVQCIACGHYMRPVWSGRREDGSRWGMRWDVHKDQSGLWSVPKVLQTVRFECEKCGHAHLWNTRTKQEWNRTGKYIQEPGASEKLKSKESFHWTAVIDYPWDQLVDLYLQAINAWKMGVVEPLITFFQKRMAEMCSEERLLEGGLNYAKEKYEIKTTPDGAIRILTADRQNDQVYWVMIRDWYPTTEDSMARSKRVFFGKCYSAAEIDKLRETFSVSEWERLRPGDVTEKGWAVYIDSGHESKGDCGVYKDCIRFGWQALKGAATAGGDELWFPHRIGDASVYRTYSNGIVVDSETGSGKSRYTFLIRFSSPTYSSRVSEMIDRGLWIEPEGMEQDPMDIECRKQMSSEFLREVVTGSGISKRVKKRWRCPSKNNHARDCAKMQIVAAVGAGIMPDIAESNPPREHVEP